jgi:hypothetical protein
MMPIVSVNCHCGKIFNQTHFNGDAGVIDCKCGCTYAYRIVQGQAEVKKVEKCPSSQSKSNANSEW